MTDIKTIAQMDDEQYQHFFDALDPGRQELEMSLFPFYRFLANELEQAKPGKKEKIEALIQSLDSLRTWVYQCKSVSPPFAAKLFFDFGLELTAYIAPGKFAAPRLNERWNDERENRQKQAVEWVKLRVRNGDIKPGEMHNTWVNEALERDRKQWEPKLKKYRPLGKTSLNDAVKKMLKDDLKRPGLIKGGSGKKKT